MSESRSRRVLWLIKGLGPGGAEMLLVNQARAATGRSCTYEAAYLVPWKDHLVSDLEAAGVAVTCFPTRREWDLRWVGALRRRLRTDPVDVVHVHSPYLAAAVRPMLRTLHPHRRPALVYTEHNEWPRHTRATRWANRITIDLDDHDLAVSEEVRASMPARVAARTEVLVHGVDVEAVAAHGRCRREVRAELGIAEEEVVVGIVANFRREKAYEDWIEAARRMPEELPVRFVSVGQGPLEEEMRQRVRSLDLDERVLLIGYREDALRVMSAFDVFTLSSVHEGLPVSLMDALALGLPIAATTAGGVPQAVTDGVEGLLVPPRRPDLLAGAVEALASDPARRDRMGAAAAARAPDFSVRRSLSRLEEIYAAVAAMSGAPARSRSSVSTRDRPCRRRE